MKQVHMFFDDRTLEMVHDYMEVEQIKTFTRAVKQLIERGILSLDERKYEEFTKELREIRREVAGTNERIDMMIRLNFEPHNKN